MVFAKWISGNDDLEKVYKIRNEVFVCENGIPEETEKDGLDGEAQHIIAYDGDSIVATGRLIVSNNRYEIGKVAVLKEFRKKKFGDLVVRMLLDKAYILGAKEIYLNSANDAIGFFERYGFEKNQSSMNQNDSENIDMILKKG